MCDLIDDPGGGVAGFSDHGMYDIRTMDVTRGHIYILASVHIWVSFCRAGKMAV